jgi:hypothetical protein
MANKIDIRADVAKNRLYIVLGGFFQDEEIRQAADKCISESSKLRPGFAAISDQREFKPATPKGTEEIKRAQLFLKQQGATLMRVVGDNVLAGAQFERQSKESGLMANTASSVAEAEKILDSQLVK